MLQPDLWLSSDNNNSCPYESIIGLFFFMAIVFAVVIAIILISLAIVLSDRVATRCGRRKAKNKLKYPICQMKSPEELERLEKPPLYAIVDKTKKKCTSQQEQILLEEEQRISRFSCDLILSQTQEVTSKRSTRTSTTASMATTVRQNPDYEALNIKNTSETNNHQPQPLVINKGEVMSRSLTSEQIYQALNPSMTFSDDIMSQSIRSNEYQYLAEAPFSCQTSIVPMTRNQFYLVLQINMNSGDLAKAKDGKSEGQEEELPCSPQPD